MENTTRWPRFRRNAAISVASVVTGTPRSLVCITAASSSRDTVASEQTGRAANSSLLWANQTRIVCFNNDSDGTRTSVRCAVSFSLMNRKSGFSPFRTP